MTRARLSSSTARLLVLAFGLSTVMPIELAAGNGFLRAFLAGTVSWQPLVLVMVMVIVSTGGIINAFTASMRPSTPRTAGTVAASALAMTTGVTASQSISALPELFYFCTMLFGQTVYAYCMTVLFVSCIKVTGRWAAVPSNLAAAAVALTGAAGFVGQSWVSLGNVSLGLALARDLAVLAAPLVLLSVLALLPQARLDPASPLNSLKLRLPLDAEGAEARALRRTALLVVAGTAVSAGANIWLRLAGAGDDPATMGLTAVSLAWAGAAYLALSELTRFSGEQRHGNVTAKIAPTSARRFLRRHLSDEQNWAATVGLKTTNFSIDHDPGGVLHGQLPASIMQIRGEEIQRCVNEVLGTLQLHSYVVGHRIFGAVDPEVSVRPCVDALKMFACLYLDAGPLVERRIKGLTALLPIVDPGLARVLRPTDVGSLIRRNVWFFHFDFSWLDQHVIHTPRNTRYDVRMATLGSRLRQSMMNHLEKTGGIGNFVWIGPEARDRLLQEAPAMKNVVEPCPVPLDLGPKGPGDNQGELLMFVIKFEQLIPRLQRYFDLDTMRKALLDFEPSQESARLLNLLALQIAKAKSPDALLGVLGSLTSVPWRGFKEKDGALQLIVAAYEQLNALVAPGATLHSAEGPKARALFERLLDAVKAIGYPSQVLHDAQISKLALRDVANLKEVAADPHHPRFPEAWLLMATTDYGRYRPDARRELLEFLRDVRRHPRIAKLPLVQAKAVDALASLGRVCQEAEVPLLAGALAEAFAWFARSAADPDICCLLLDAHLFLSSHLGGSLVLPARAIAELDHYVCQLTAELGPAHAKVIAIMSRWQEFRAKAPAAA